MINFCNLAKMKKMKNRILALIDLSENTEKFYLSINYFFKIIGGELLLVHEINKLIPSFTDSEQKKKLLLDEKNEAVKAIKKQSSLLELDNIEVLVTDKNVINYINELKSEDKNEWIITGLKPFDNFKSFFTKSTILKLIEETHFIKLIIPCNKEITLIKHLKFATHPNFPVNLEKLKTVIQSFGSTLETITFYTIIDDSDDFFKIDSHLNDLANNFPNQKIVTKIIQKKDANITIGVEFGFETLLVIQKGPRNFLDLIFRKLTINQILESNITPLIILP